MISPICTFILLSFGSNILALGTDENEDVKETPLAVGGDGYDDTKIATKGYVDSRKVSGMWPFLSLEADVNGYKTYGLNAINTNVDIIVPFDSMLVFEVSATSFNGNVAGYVTNYESGNNTLVNVEFTGHPSYNYVAIDLAMQHISGEYITIYSGNNTSLRMYVQSGTVLRLSNSSNSGNLPNHKLTLIPVTSNNTYRSKTPISLCDITVSPTAYTCNSINDTNLYPPGTVCKPQIDIVDPYSGETLVEGTDYTVSYYNNTMPEYEVHVVRSTNTIRLNRNTSKVGMIVITGIGNYTSSSTINFTMTSTDGAWCGAAMVATWKYYDNNGIIRTAWDYSDGQVVDLPPGGELTWPEGDSHSISKGYFHVKHYTVEGPQYTLDNVVIADSNFEKIATYVQGGESQNYRFIVMVQAHPS